jgi:hypothetical protein
MNHLFFQHCLKSEIAFVSLECIDAIKRRYEIITLFPMYVKDQLINWIAWPNKCIFIAS